uniref:Uncharacterized protein n=1 Tax=Arundo donax TaxID=35708 RepID=A0A0A9BLJ1_ARUDO
MAAARWRGRRTTSGQRGWAGVQQGCDAMQV